MKQLFISEQQKDLQKVKQTAVSTLITLGEFDYVLFDTLLKEIPQNPSYVIILGYILEDVKADSENNNLFTKHQFIHSLKNLFSQLLTILNSLQKEDLRSNKQVVQYLKCLNSLILQGPPQLNP